jgi:hypothetical protein
MPIPFDAGAAGVATGRAPDGDLISLEHIENKGTHMELTQSWFVAKAAIALSPIIGFGTADLIRWLLRRAGWQRTATKPQSEL